MDRKQSSEELFLIKLIKDCSERLKNSYNYSNDELYNLYGSEVTIPAAIFNSILAPSEAITKYIKENLDKNYREIGEILDRNERSVWLNYQRAISKKVEMFDVPEENLIPATIFVENKLSIFEAVVKYLHENKKISFVKIAKLLGKNSANVWSVYKRSTKKKGVTK